MTRRYADAITVRRGPTGAAEAPRGGRPNADAPEQFVWRGRRYRVLAVVQRWVETGAWWRAGGAVGEDGKCHEYEIWRVEAVAGRLTGHAGQYDLCRFGGTDRWFLIRAFD